MAFPPILFPEHAEAVQAEEATARSAAPSVALTPNTTIPEARPNSHGGCGRKMPSLVMEFGAELGHVAALGSITEDDIHPSSTNIR